MRIIHSQHWGNPFGALLFLCSFWCQNTGRKSKKGGVGQPLPDRAAPCPLDQTRQMCRLHRNICGNNPQSKLPIPSLLAANRCVCSCCRVGGQQGSTAAAILCVCRSPVNSSPRPSLIFPLSSLSCFKPRAGGEEWMTFSCLLFLCQKISKRHSSSLNGYNQSIPGHNKVGPIKS